MMIKDELLRCREWIESALKKGGDTHSFKNVVDGVLSGKMQLWHGSTGCAVTELVVYPKKKVLHVFLAGGTLDQILDMHSDAVKWAKKQGCDGMTLSGRRGWKKALESKGWNEKLTTMAKEF